MLPMEPFLDGSLPDEQLPGKRKQGPFSDPVVEMKQALYGHPDAGGYWERHCDAGVKAAGFEPIGDCFEWRSCYFNHKTKVLCVIYVDDFKARSRGEEGVEGHS